MHIRCSAGDSVDFVQDHFIALPSSQAVHSHGQSAMQLPLAMEFFTPGDPFTLPKSD